MTVVILQFFKQHPYSGLGHLIVEISRSHAVIHRIPLDEELARRRDPYLTKHNIYTRHTCPWRDSNLQSLQWNG
jgi:hypothetical protein